MSKLTNIKIEWNENGYIEDSTFTFENGSVMGLREFKADSYTRNTLEDIIDMVDELYEYSKDFTA
jgi:hypothetical protein